MTVVEVALVTVPAFADLLPDELHRKLELPAKPHAERMKRFFAKGLVFQADGERLPGRLIAIEPRERIRRDLVSGEAIAVAIRVMPGRALDRESLRSWCSSRIHREAVPEHWYFVDSIPRSERGKLNRDLVRHTCVGST